MPRVSATFHWQGNGAGTKSAYNDGRNWVNDAGAAYAQNQYPGYDADAAANVDGDTILFDSAPTTAIAGYDASALGDHAAIRVTKDYNLAIASSGAKLIVDMQAAGSALIDAQAAGDIYLKGGGARGLQSVMVMAVKAGSTCYLDGKLDAPKFLKGNVNLAATAVVSTSMLVAFVSNPASDVTLTITSGATLPATVEVLGGIITSAAAPATLRMMSGLWTHTAGNITTLEQFAGVVKWNAGNITTLQLYGGKCDGSAGVGARTLGAVYVYPGGTLDLNNGLKNITWTQIVCQGGSIIWSPGTGVVAG